MKTDPLERRVNKLEELMATHLQESGALQNKLETLGVSMEKIESHQWAVVMSALGCAGALVVSLLGGIVLAFVKLH